jgi:hypothetical protein
MDFQRQRPGFARPFSCPAAQALPGRFMSNGQACLAVSYQWLALLLSGRFAAENTLTGCQS